MSASSTTVEKRPRLTVPPDDEESTPKKACGTITSPKSPPSLKRQEWLFKTRWPGHQPPFVQPPAMQPTSPVFAGFDPAAAAPSSPVFHVFDPAAAATAPSSPVFAGFDPAAAAAPSSPVFAGFDPAAAAPSSPPQLTIPSEPAVFLRGMEVETNAGGDRGVVTHVSRSFEACTVRFPAKDTGRGDDADCRDMALSELTKVAPRPKDRVVVIAGEQADRGLEGTLVGIDDGDGVLLCDGAAGMRVVAMQCLAKRVQGEE